MTTGVAQRRLLLLAVLAGLAWTLWDAGLGRIPLVNMSGWPQVRDFLTAAAAPETSAELLRIVGQATLATLAYAVLGTALALLLGAIGGLLLSQVCWRGGWTWGGRLGWVLARGVLALPRGLHEAVWALLLVNVLGLDPLVAVLAIGLPYGAITAKVYADLLDEAPRGPYLALLAAGAGRGAALLYGLLPLAAADLLSYACYRLECSVRSAVVLGVIGAGGLGFQLDLSFAALRYREMWTVIAALVVLCAAADLAGSALRARLGRVRPVSSFTLPLAVLVVLGLISWSWHYLDVHPATLWSPRAVRQAHLVAAQAWPPTTDAPFLGELWRSSLQTFQMSLLALVLAATFGLVLAVVAAHRPAAGPARRGAELAARALLLVARAVPPPVWALLILFLLYPGLLPGALALGAYNAGVLGRLMAEAQESLPVAPARALEASGASRAATWWYAVWPRVLPKDLAYGLYRWEVATRETVIVGMVGAGGLGQLLARQTAGFDWPAVTATLLALIGLTLVVDLLSAAARTACR